MQLGREVLFAVERFNDGFDETVVIQGELDMATCPVVSSCIESIIAEGATRIVFDFAAVTFMDVRGISLLIRAKYSLNGDAQVVIRHPAPMVRRILRITRVDNIMTIED